MKRIIFIVVATFIFLISVMLLLALAGDFDAKDVTPNENADITNKISFSKYNSAEVAFSDFDVNEDGSLLLVSRSEVLDPAIYVYDSEGKFQYKYTVETDGELCAEWQGSNIWIYVFRGDRAVLVDDSGNLVEATQIAEPASNTAYWDAVCAKEKTVGDKKYVAKTEVGALVSFLNEYDCVSVSDKNGEEEILYNAMFSLWGKVIFMVLSVFAVLFVGGSAVVLTVKRIARRRSEKSEDACPT